MAITALLDTACGSVAVAARCTRKHVSGARFLCVQSIIGRIHGAIVAATVGAIVAATIACSVYTGQLSRRQSPRRSLRPVAATIAPCIRAIILLHYSLLTLHYITTSEHTSIGGALNR